MTQKSESNQNPQNTSPIIMAITDAETIRILLHDQKKEILNIIMREPKNIQELKIATGMNPGTIKRNLDELMEKNLVRIVKIEKSDYNITMKYYQAVAKKFEIRFTLPE